MAQVTSYSRAALEGDEAQFITFVNEVFQAILTNSAGPVAPNETSAHMTWLDTSTSPWTLRRRNAANNAWDVALAFASQVEAEAGSDNTKAMSPLRVKQAIEKLSAPRVDRQVFDVSGTWIKPAGYSHDAIVKVSLWGGGGGGGSGSYSNGGGGGGFCEFYFRLGDLPGSVPVVVGSGGAVNISGGNTEFSNASGYGGGGGGVGVFEGGGGGGSGSSASGRIGGLFGGGAGGNNENRDGSDATSSQGGGGGGSISGVGGRAFQGGGGGGAIKAGGISIHGGNGGNSGVAGSTPSGGGGNGAQGAPGKAIIEVWE